GLPCPCTSTRGSGTCCRSSRAKWVSSGWTNTAANGTSGASTGCRRTCSTTRRRKGPGMHYLLFYEKVRDAADRETPHQAAHRAHARAAVSRGEWMLGGPLADPLDGAQALLFRADSAATAEAFAAADPYVRHGIVSRWRVRPWQTVVGE